MAQLYAVLYLSGKPLSLDDMVERLKISKGSASVNIRALERYGVVLKIWVKGSRKDYYEAEENISRVIMDRIKSIAERSIADVDKMINYSKRALEAVVSEGSGEAEEVKIFKQRLDKLNGLHAKAKASFNLLNSSLVNGILNRSVSKEKTVVLK